MTAEAAINAALKEIGLPHARIIYTGKASTFCTYQLVSEQEEEHAEDGCVIENWLYRVDVFARGSPMEHVLKIKKALKAQGFVGIFLDPEVYEADTGFYHVPIEARYFEEV